MALPATDNFNRADGALGSNWTVALGGFLIASNAVRANNAGDESGALWNADTFANDQYSQATYTLGWGDDIGVAVRVSGSGGSAKYYLLYIEGSNGYFGKVFNGVYSEFAFLSGGFANNDVIRIEAEGTTIRAKRNGTTVSSTTDTTITTGAAGLSAYNSGGAARIDNWEGGNLGAVAATSPVLMCRRTLAGLLPR